MQENYIYGIHPVTEAVLSGKTINKLFIQKGLRGDFFRELFVHINTHNIPYQYVPFEKLQRITKKNHQGIIAFISPVSFATIENVLPSIFENGKTPLLLILDRITDVRNLGAIVRTAEGAGVDAVIIPFMGSAQINADAIKTSSGALHHVPICREKNLKEIILFLKNSGLQIVACTEKTNNSYYTADYTLPTAVVLGSEENGISEAYLKLSDFQVKIPMQGKVESLNVSVATGVILYEVIRQRNFVT